MLTDVSTLAPGLSCPQNFIATQAFLSSISATQTFCCPSTFSRHDLPGTLVSIPASCVSVISVPTTLQTVSVTHAALKARETGDEENPTATTATSSPSEASPAEEKAETSPAGEKAEATPADSSTPASSAAEAGSSPAAAPDSSTSEPSSAPTSAPHSGAAEASTSSAATPESSASQPNSAPTSAPEANSSSAPASSSPASSSPAPSSPAPSTTTPSTPHKPTTASSASAPPTSTHKSKLARIHLSKPVRIAILVIMGVVVLSLLTLFICCLRRCCCGGSKSRSRSRGLIGANDEAWTSKGSGLGISTPDQRSLGTGAYPPAGQGHIQMRERDGTAGYETYRGEPMRKSLQLEMERAHMLQMELERARASTGRVGR